MIIIINNINNDTNVPVSPNSLYFEQLPKHTEYKNADVIEKSNVRNNCAKIIQIAEEVKSKIKARYQREYDEYLEKKVSSSFQIDVLDSHRIFFNSISVNIWPTSQRAPASAATSTWGAVGQKSEAAERPVLDQFPTWARQEETRTGNGISSTSKCKPPVSSQWEWPPKRRR